MNPVVATPRMLRAPQSGAALSASHMESHLGRRAKAKGCAPLGLSAALWDIGLRDRSELSRPACPHTHVVSVWTRGATYSELTIDGARRFSQIRDTGSFQLARAGEQVRAVLTKASGYCLDLYLPAAIVERCLETECEGTSAGFELLPLRVERDSDIIKISEAITQEITTPGLASRMALDSATLSLAVALIRRWSNQSVRTRPARSGLAPWQVRRSLDRLEAALAEDVSLEDLAREVGLSPFHFARAFKVSVGAPPHRHHVTLRLERARKLLETTKLGVLEIATAVGYEDASYFARRFSREYGLTPNAYRRARGV